MKTTNTDGGPVEKGTDRGHNDLAAALFSDATTQARWLKRKHRRYYNSDLKGFRAQVQRAHARVFRSKPGPKMDARIIEAARKRVSGETWGGLYAEFIGGYPSMSEYTRSLAEEGLRKKVNTYLQRHPRQRRNWLRVFGAQNPR